MELIYSLYFRCDTKPHHDLFKIATSVLPELVRPFSSEHLFILYANINLKIIPKAVIRYEKLAKICSLKALN